MGGALGKILSVAAPIVGNAIAPGIGAVIGGALGGAANGGGLKGALTGGLTGGAMVYAPQIGGIANEALGLGLGQAGVSALGGALGGGAVGALTGGGLSGALKSAALAGAGGYLTNGGLSDLGITGEGGILGTGAGTPLAGRGVGPTQGTGILGAATQGLSGVGSAIGTNGGGGSSSFNGLGTLATALGGLGTLATALGGLNSYSANKKALQNLQTAGNQAIAQYQPYQATGVAANSRLSDLLGTSSNTNAAGYGSLMQPFNPGDLTQDPGYKFRLEQGQQALDRKQAASGNYFSGAALKDAQDYGQGLADQTYKDAYDRYLQQNQQTYGMLSGQANAGLNAASGAANTYENIGSAKANAGISGSNIMNNTLSSLLSGSGARRFLGYSSGGQPIYV